MTPFDDDTGVCVLNCANLPSNIYPCCVHSGPRGRHSGLHHCHATLFLDALLQRGVQPSDVAECYAVRLPQVRRHHRKHHGDAPCGCNRCLDVVNAGKIRQRPAPVLLYVRVT